MTWVSVRVKVKDGKAPKTIRVAAQCQPRADWPRRCRCRTLWRVHPADTKAVLLAYDQPLIGVRRHFVCQHIIVPPKRQDEPR